MTKKGGQYDKMIIISFFKDTYTALKEPLRIDIEALVKKKEHCESVWYTLLALYIYQKCLMPYSAQLTFTILFAIAWLKQNGVAKPELYLKSLQRLEFKKTF